MAGVLGTALMLLESSGVGARVSLDAVPRPPGVALLRWLTAFPSFGFVLSVRPRHRDQVLAAFAGRGLAAAVIGTVEASSALCLQHGSDTDTLWDWAEQPFIRAAESVHHD